MSLIPKNVHSSILFRGHSGFLGLSGNPRQRLEATKHMQKVYSAIRGLNQGEVKHICIKCRKNERPSPVFRLCSECSL